MTIRRAHSGSSFELNSRTLPGCFEYSYSFRNLVWDDLTSARITNDKLSRQDYPSRLMRPDTGPNHFEEQARATPAKFFRGLTDRSERYR